MINTNSNEHKLIHTCIHVYLYTMYTLYDSLRKECLYTVQRTLYIVQCILYIANTRTHATTRTMYVVQHDTASVAKLIAFNIKALSLSLSLSDREHSRPTGGARLVLVKSIRIDVI